MRLLSVLVALFLLPAAALAGPPPTPVPTSLTVGANAKGGVLVTVRVANLTASNADSVSLEIFTTRPNRHYAVHRNGPGLPVTVNPIPGHPEGQSTGTATRSIRHGTIVFSFGWKTVADPHGMRVRAVSGSESDGIGHATAWVRYTG